MSEKTKYTAASLFCGAGGLDVGFHNAGFKTVWANDFNKDACDTFRSWSNAEVVCGDIKLISSEEIPRTDIILGGFPCQGFSLSGPRREDDLRNQLYKQYVRIVKDKQPLAFVGENVKGLLSMGNGSVFERIGKDFSDCGYSVFCQLVNAKGFGVPQDRERVILAGFRKDLGITDFMIPESIAAVTLADALKDIPAPNEGDVCMASYSSRYMSRNRKRGWDDVSFTIPAMAKQVPLYPGSPDMIKVDKDLWKFGEGETRRLSWQEAAAIQTFPSDFRFCGNLDSKYRQIGNAVPVNLAAAVAHEILRKFGSLRTGLL